MNRPQPPAVVPTQPAPFPEHGRRLIIYVVYDRRGEVEEYIPFALNGLRAHAAHIMVVVNGTLSDAGRELLTPLADDILVRENVGYDIWAHKAGLDRLGDRVAEFDEVVLTNDTWFGPVRPFGPVLERMDVLPLHFWGLTDHAREEVNPFTGRGDLPYHLQSFWIAARREMVQSDEWKRYWRELPEMPGYVDAVLKHEVQFTQHFNRLGYASEAAFACEDYPTEHPALFNPDLLLADGCPVIKRRPFFHFPPFLDRHAVIGREVLREVEAYGYPMELIWADLSRNVEPKILNADAGMLEVLPDVDVSYDATAPLRTVAILHIFYPEMTHEMLDRVDTLPGAYDLVVTTPDADRAARITALIAERPREGRSVDVRVVASNNGRDQSAFLIGCRDILLSDRYDIVVKLHSKKTPQDGHNIGRHFRRQQFDNLLDSPGYTANLLALFQREQGLGLVYPPMIHIGYPTMGRAWWANKKPFAALAAELGIRVPLDDVSPLAPYGGMYIARVAALRILAEHEWTYEQFGGADAYQDGGLAHVLERMPSYAAGELGFHTRTVSTREYMSISHTALEYKLDQLAAGLPGDMVEQIRLLRGMGHLGEGRLIDLLRLYANLHMPKATASIRKFVGRSSPLGQKLAEIRESWG
ncbi:rhamnan synthesis F family protein [Microbacterium sp. ASV49]|uniref:Rhamnan synthesis F family protein n=1 Tax=Microbacterium candidum TaxID=3041922 RepID=A0ABT7N0T0_9MICO|nr:rhamnan synthesis F family protein [Microbacterium sp. ASV49]MDL9980314.1 rhamnan synthesis F family protein [Microbacterium sp. ASV49]